ncbi:MAG: DUF4389 domain-containing protein [SAR202 cluster bacterium]|nr:DUF4389 domain-containing protein [SAR202 cluster bacterium]
MDTLATKQYPAKIRGQLEEPISSWLFLIKWLLLLPHWVLLIFLYIGFIFSWLGSMIAIAFTGKYPRALFDYNVGVIRWGWRVGFYSYQAMGTNKYPPFSLQPLDSYPADITIDYPEKLHRGVVLIKWWLLALPHYAVVALLVGGAGYRFGGLQILLVLFATVGNLFNKSYPKDLWELVMGINHLVYRVFAYAALTTDEYPPFRLGE